jgi:hypothetical protein
LREEKGQLDRKRGALFRRALAPHAKIRSQIVPKKEEALEPTPTTSGETEPNKPKRNPRMCWAELLARVFQIDMKHCPQCQSENFKPIAAIIEVSVVREILTHLGLPDKPPDIAPARLSPQD